MMRGASNAWLVLTALLSSHNPAIAQSVADFYHGKTITLTIGVAAGGGNDAYARLIARHLGRFLPGTPTVVIQQMPGAGGLRHLNYLYNIAPKNGTAIGATEHLTPFEPLLAGKDSKATFDPLQFGWLGSPERFSAVALSWHTSPVKTAKDLLTHELVVGAEGVVTGSSNDAYVLRNILGFKFRVVLGYSGGAAVDLAMERGELQGRSNSGYQGIKTRHPQWLTNHMVNVLYQIGLRKNPDMPSDVPLVLDFAKNAADRAVLELKFASFELGYPYIAPPGTPSDRLAALQAAFAAMTSDPAFEADARAQRLDVGPISAERIEAVLRRSFTAPRETIDRLIGASKPPN
jgi:tripartite-type tricarboxylate transporter receptor subunit TctC